MVWNGYIWRTDNRGASWTQTAFSRDTSLDSNGDVDRIAGQKLAVDPADEDTAYFGTKTNGVWYTHNAGTSWSQISTATIPAGTGSANPGHAGICFDPTSGTNGSGYTNTYLVTVTASTVRQMVGRTGPTSRAPAQRRSGMLRSRQTGSTTVLSQSL